MGIFTDQWGNPDIFKIGGICAAVALAGCPVGCTVMNNVQYGNGIRVGVVNKISKKGYVWKTFEGELVLEGLVSNGQTSGANLWDFSLDNEQRHGENIEELARTITECAETGTKVKIKYIQPWGTWPWRSGTDYLVQSVEPLSQLQQNTGSKLDLVKQAADTNHDGKVSPGEWAKVYEELGIAFDPMSPRKLTELDFDRYLAAHKRTPR